MVSPLEAALIAWEMVAWSPGTLIVAALKQAAYSNVIPRTNP
jgi:hypothetical protein